MFLSLFFSFISSATDPWPQPQTWSGFSPTQSWPPTKIPAQTWPTSTPNWDPTRSVPPEPSPDDHHSKITTGVIVAISVSSAVFVILIISLVIFRKKLFCSSPNNVTLSATLNEELISDKTV